MRAAQVNTPGVLYPELSYQIVGAAFAVCNELGVGYKEVYYQRAFAEELSKRKIPFVQEKAVDLRYGNKKVGQFFLDFLIDDKVVVELKVRSRLGYTNVKQVMSI
jgi:GxxExxY protein